MNRGPRYTRHKLSTWQVAMLADVDRGRRVYYYGKTLSSLMAKGLIAQPRRDGLYCRASLTAEGYAALNDARQAGALA